MSSIPELPPGRNAFDRVIQGLRHKDPVLNELCTDILVRVQTEGGVNGVSQILAEATKKGTNPHHRVRILEVIRRIGAQLSPDDFYTVLSLAQHPSSIVSLKALDLIVELRSARSGTADQSSMSRTDAALRSVNDAS